MEFDRVGKYKILGEIGRGTMGRVFKAQDPVLGRFVAIKTLTSSLGATEESRKRFHREAQAAAVLSHPNIVTVHDFGEEKGLIYMAMELLEGKDLRDALADGDLRTLDDKLRVMEQVMAGLSFAHAKGVIHRDLKPANIHIQPNGQVKILDFGLARFPSSQMTQDGIVLGTPNYMSPEQALGDKIDARSDVFAAGAVFYEALTGHKPFDAESTPGVLYQVVHKQPRPVRELLPEAPQILAELVEKALHKDKALRFQSARQMRAALAVARQALEAGRGSNATLADESQRALRAAMREEPPKGSPDGPTPPPSVAPAGGSEGTGPRPKPASGYHAPAAADPGRGSGRRAASRSSRTGALVVGGLVLLLLVGLTAAYVLWWSHREPKPVVVAPTPAASGSDVSALTQALVETQIQLAVRDLDDKNYAAAIDEADRVLKLDRQNAEARRIRSEAEAKRKDLETAASEAQQAADAGEKEKASRALSRLLELDPRHPIAASLTEKLNSAFKSQADDAGRTMERSRADAERAKAENADGFAQAVAAARNAQALFQKGDYAEATRGYLEARDGFDRARRAVKAPVVVPPSPRPSTPRPSTDTSIAASSPGPSTAPPSTAASPVEPPRPTHAFVTGKTQVASARGGGDIQGFDTADVKTQRQPDFIGHIEFEMDPATVQPGDPFVVRVFVVNQGKKPVRVRTLALTTILNGRRSSAPVTTAGVHEVPPLGRGQVAETRLVWPDGVTSWALEAAVTSDRDETGTSRLTWQ